MVVGVRVDVGERDAGDAAPGVGDLPYGAQVAALAHIRDAFDERARHGAVSYRRRARLAPVSAGSHTKWGLPALPVGKLPAQLLQRLFTKYVVADPRVLIGPQVGEDAAVLDMGDRYLVATTAPTPFRPQCVRGR